MVGLRFDSCLIVVAPGGHHQDDERDCENQRVIRLVVFDADEESGTQPEPLPGECRDFAIAALQIVFPVQKVSDCLEIVATFDIHGEAVAAEGEEITLDVGQPFTIPPKLVIRSPIEDLLFDVNELVALEILERELVTQARQLSLHLEFLGAVESLDRKIVAERDELLFQDVIHIRSTLAGDLACTSSRRSASPPWGRNRRCHVARKIRALAPPPAVCASPSAKTDRARLRAKQG